MSNTRAIIYIIIIIIYLIRVTLLKNDCIFFDKLNSLIDSDLLTKMRNIKEKIFKLIKNEFYIFSLYMGLSFLIADSTYIKFSTIMLTLMLVFIELKLFKHNLLCDEYYNEGLLDDIDKAISKLKDE